MENLQSKIVVITGASAGVGRATAHEFAKAGAKVVLLARNKESLEGAKKEVEDLCGEAYYYVLDVSDSEKVEEVIDGEGYGAQDFTWGGLVLDMMHNEKYEDMNWEEDTREGKKQEN